MALPCNKKTNLEVDHIDRYGEPVLSNARVLCQDCHANTRSYGQPRDGRRPKKEFPLDVKNAALIRSGFQCECTKDNCH